jgi:uncharacterized damage-inducible protein DinB
VSPTVFPADEIPYVSDLSVRWTDLEKQVRTYLDNAGDQGLHRIIPYRLMSGKEGASPLWQMVAHVVNHATYHRGQVTTMLRQLGAAPARSTDMISYFRELTA